MNKASISKKVCELIDPIALEEGLEVVDVDLTKDLGRTILRVLVDKREGPISLGDCARFSHLIEDLLEVEGVVPVIYDLEVSSPGVNRLLKKPEHFQKVLGKMVRIKTGRPLDGRANYKGILKAVNDLTLVVEVDRKDYELPFSEIEKANLEFFNWPYINH